MESYGRGRDTEVRHWTFLKNCTKLQWKFVIGHVCAQARTGMGRGKWGNEALCKGWGELRIHFFRSFSSINMHLIPTALNMHWNQTHLKHRTDCNTDHNNNSKALFPQWILQVTGMVNQLRDPAILTDLDGTTFLFYTGAGEQNIGVVKLELLSLWFRPQANSFLLSTFWLSSLDQYLLEALTSQRFWPQEPKIAHPKSYSYKTFGQVTSVYLATGCFMCTAFVRNHQEYKTGSDWKKGQSTL